MNRFRSSNETVCGIHAFVLSTFSGTCEFERYHGTQSKQNQIPVSLNTELLQENSTDELADIREVGDICLLAEGRWPAARARSLGQVTVQHVQADRYLGS